MADPPAASPSAELLWVRGGTLIDATGRAPMRHAWILIDRGIIIRVGEAGSFPRPKGARVLHAGGLTILPGLIDAHVHLSTSGVVGLTFRRPQPQGEGVLLRNARAELLGGVTLVRDLHMPLAFAHSLTAVLQRDPTAGARLIYAGPILTAPEGYGSPYAVPVATPEEGRERVAELVREGARVVKIAVTSRQLGGTPLPPMTAEVAAAIVSEAHRRGLPVAAHVSGATLADLRVAVQAGVDSLEHMPGESGATDMPDVFYSSSGLLSEILSRGIAIVPTLSVEAGDDFGPTIEGLADDPALLLRLGPAQREILAENLEDFFRNRRRQTIAAAGRERMKLFLTEVQRLHAAGVRLCAGTDAGNGFTFHGNLFTEIEYLHQGGLTAMEAIQAATRDNARLLGVLRDQGTVEEGKRADLLMVRGDPLSDLEALRRVERVVIAGRDIEVHRLLKKAVRQAKKRSQQDDSSK